MNNLKEPLLTSEQLTRLRQKMVTVLSPIYYKELLRRAPEDGLSTTIDDIADSALDAVDYFTWHVEELFEDTFDIICDTVVDDTREGLEDRHNEFQYPTKEVN